MPAILVILFAAGGGAFAFWKSRNGDGQIPAGLPGTFYTWRVEGGWSGSFRAFWGRPTKTSQPLGGEFETFDAAKGAALEAIAIADEGVGVGGLRVGIGLQPTKAKFLDQ